MTKFIEIPASSNSLLQRRPVCGVGINDSWYATSLKKNGKNYRCPFYTRWKEMIRRCYSEKFKLAKPTYEGCSVCDEWLTFSNFRKWMKTQDWEGKELDKDLIIAGNKIYGPDRCVFVSVNLNRLLTDNAASRGDHPLGVRFHKSTMKYIADCNIDGKAKYLGLYNTAKQAEYAYLSFKSKLLIEISKGEEALSNKDIQSALLRHAEIFKNKAELLK